MEDNNQSSSERERLQNWLLREDTEEDRTRRSQMFSFGRSMVNSPHNQGNAPALTGEATHVGQDDQTLKEANLARKESELFNNNREIARNWQNFSELALRDQIEAINIYDRASRPIASPNQRLPAAEQRGMTSSDRSSSQQAAGNVPGEIQHTEKSKLLVDVPQDIISLYCSIKGIHRGQNSRNTSSSR